MERGAKVDPFPDVDYFTLYIEAFNELSTCRNMSNQIPFTAIAEYAKIYQMDDFKEFLFLIRKMDKKYLRLKNGNGNKVDNSKNQSNR